MATKTRIKILCIVGTSIIALTNHTTCWHARALSLPPHLQKAVARGLLVQPHGRPDVFVLGTVHVGSESAEEASLLIETVRPSTVVVEVAPSRLPLIRKRNKENESNNKRKAVAAATIGETDLPQSRDYAARRASSSTVQFQTALRSLPALAQKGWTTGGVGGLIFSIAILWGSLLKRSLTAAEESDALPRTDEFAAAIAAADEIGSTVVPADMEIDELIGSIARSMTAPADWISLGKNVVMESLGAREADPIRRRRDESLLGWAERRRDVATSRASRAHGEAMAPCISRVLVDERDGMFAESCVGALRSRGGGDRTGDVIVCVVGLVHVDGVVERLETLLDIR
eukprot:CAMPEP_0181124506 /NCGR_PEP_ID=MMETSP1071-20121207/26519_1 /TAXON_ID=35127 /ORGANISM="Thalassiosira sp., Strain NH16" /LENGTH=343 /DNA_ID=CAMNT_0023209819 /DNA_START=144 /DNA_END=1175 /DNA_ORIENTATION=-